VFERLLPYYQSELEALKRLAGEFAEANPKVAGHLRLASGAVDDPHVSRLLEGMAFLTGRVRHRLDDEFPELTDALLDMLQPHFLAPVPPCLIARLSCAPNLTNPARLPRGLMVDTDPIAGAPCRFMTTAPVTLWPIEVDQARLSGLPLPAPANPRAQRAVAVLRLGLRCLAPDMTLGKLGLDALHVQLRGDGAPALFELLAGHLVSVALAQGPNDPLPTLLDPAALEPAGFTAEEALLPWPARSFSGFRLLTEHFALPDKFLGFTLRGLDARTLVEAQRRMDLFFYLDRAAPELERTVGPDSLALGCVPLVNLFPQRCEPIGALHTRTEHRVVPDARRPKTLEVWSVERVRETRSDGTWRPWRPLHRLTHGDRDPGVPGGSFHATRRPAVDREAGGEAGSDVFLALHDHEFDPAQSFDTVLSVDALCTNRELAARLPFAAGQPRLHLVEGIAAVTGLQALTAPTPTLRPQLRERTAWRLVSHLGLGHLSVTGGDQGAGALREVLRLYDRRDTAETQAAIAALVGVHTKPGVARSPSGGFCRGLDVTLEFDPQAWGSGGLYGLAAVLARFLALHTTVNSFVRTRAVLRGRPEAVGQWPARAGARALA